MEVCLIFMFLSSLTANGVFGDEVKSVSVTEGHSVTLHTDIVRQRDDLIMWYYGPENTFVARLNGKADSTIYSDDERFRDRVKMNNQTGDLTITHITSQHSGLYKLKISSNSKVSYKKFNLTVYARPVSNQTHLHIRDDCDTCADSSASMVTITVVIALVISTTIIIWLCVYIYKRDNKSRMKKSYAEVPQSDEESGMREHI